MVHRKLFQTGPVGGWSRDYNLSKLAPETVTDDAMIALFRDYWQYDYRSI